MNVFLVIRYVTFGLVILFSGLTASFSALVLGFVTSGIIIFKSPSVVEGLTIYLVTLSLLSILFLLFVIGIELCRKGALTSRIWFELIWTFLFFLTYLGGSVATTVLFPSAICHADGTAKMACMASSALITFSWITASLYIIYCLALLVFALTRSRHYSKIWSASVLDQPRRQTTLPPVMITHTYSQSIDGPLNGVHQISFKGALSSADNSPTQEKEKRVRHNGVMAPVFTVNPNMNGPPTFGNGPSHVPRSGSDLGQAYANDVTGRNVGVNAINGAPDYRAHHPTGSYQFQKHPYRSGRNDSERTPSPAGHAQYTQRQAPWLSGEETPSPAVIKYASRATAAPPSVSLYPVHVVNAGLTTQTAKPSTPTATSALSGFLRIKDQHESKTSLPYMNTSRGTSERSIASASVSRTTTISHRQSQSVDSFVQVGQSGMERAGAQDRGERNERSTSRGRRTRPIHKPPPLNLLGLSNIANADRR